MSDTGQVTTTPPVPMCTTYPPRVGSSCLSYIHGPSTNPYQFGVNRASTHYHLTLLGLVGLGVLLFVMALAVIVTHNRTNERTIMHRIKATLTALAIAATLLIVGVGAANNASASRVGCGYPGNVVVHSSGTNDCFVATGQPEYVQLPNTTYINRGGYAPLYINWWACADYHAAYCTSNYYHYRTPVPAGNVSPYGLGLYFDIVEISYT